MNISLFSILFRLLPLLPMLEANFALEVKELTGTDDGLTKVNQTIAVLEDTLAKLKAALT